ncbi:MAG: nucleotidyl transferase AbiEii/AbiGii toxin family protein [Phycisphaerales bacterium]|nr:nucleotidyl transferase AbiEii/AbiGii toxin family protein [Phycisphaerales bacterium]MCI0629068.1 nucleotidyl transferase AbiEii/AbiGii toxin family protein [Phycisphaerales bacterium]MCI0675634.1 nucleotidyl transferase AbiEii/AbiGii toxin family protein [Phycisphaerales bacterium]
MATPRASNSQSMIPYEQQLDANPSWALNEGGMHFENESAVHKTLRRIARRLDDLEIPYAVAGGMALFFHGYRRFTEDVDILITREGKDIAHRALEGLGYLPPFAGSKNLRDAESGVRIEFLIAGDYPGDGKPKPVRFPDPAQVAVSIDGVKFLSLPSLIELKLASGLTNPRRAKDLVDVQELIDVLRLTEDFANQLSPFVQAKYRELWRIVHENPA